MGRTSVCSVCDGICQSTALVREPSRYRVGTAAEKDNWWTVASKDGWGDPWGLIEYNFKTRNPEEVNWYLYHFVGCRVAHDRKNFSFDGASPGIIYTRKNHYAMNFPVSPKPLPVTPQPLFKRGLTWFGAGVQVGGMNLVTGGAYVQAFVFNLEDLNSYFWLQIDTRRTGWGAGASIGAMAVIITGLYDPYTVVEAPAGSWDFDLALMGKWGSVVKGLRVVPNMGAVVRAARTVGRNVRPGLLGECATAAKLVLKSQGISDASNDLAVHLVELPLLGAGLQGSVYYGESTYRPHGVHVTPDEWEDQ